MTGTAAGQVPVLAAAIETATARVVERARAAEKAGAAAIVATAPFCTRTHPTGLGPHFRAVAAAVPLPLFRLVDAVEPGTASGTTGGIGGFKTALALLGHVGTPVVSAPMRPHTPAETARVRACMEEAGLL